MALLRDPGEGERDTDVAPNSDPDAAAPPSGWRAADADLTVCRVTGNGVPQLGGETRPGGNLFLCSVVAST
jgi:hypothetical protein